MMKLCDKIKMYKTTDIKHPYISKGEYRYIKSTFILIL